MTILPNYPCTACSLAEVCFVLRQGNACFNPRGYKEQLGNVAGVLLMLYLPEHVECLKQQLSEGALPCSSAVKQVHPCCKVICVCVTFLKEAAALVQNGSGGGKRAVEIVVYSAGMN